MQRRHRLASNGHRYVHIVKPRQFGFTTDYAIDMLDDALWIPGMSCGIIAHKQKTLSSIFEIIKRAYESMPAELKPLTRYDTRNEYKFKSRFDNVKLDSEIYVALEIRGSTLQRLHISEAAYIKDRGELKRGAKQTVSKTGKITEESTGNGMEGWFDDVMEAWEKQKSGKMTEQDYYVAFYPWVENPEYTLDGRIPEGEKTDDELKIIDLAKQLYNITVTDGQLLWRRWKIDELKSRSDGIILNTKQQFMQEYPLTLMEAFQSGAGNVFDLQKVNEMVPIDPIGGVDAYKQIHANWETLQPIEQAYKKDIHAKYLALTQLGVKFWHLPEKDVEYVLGCDPSDGIGGDDSCVDIFTKEPVNGKILQCAQFYGQMRPDLLAEICKQMAELYNDAFAGVENNMLTTILFLSKIYDNYFMEVKIDTKLNKRTTKIGFSTNNATRDPMIDDYRILWEDDLVEVNSGITIKQMKTFVKKENGKREHAEGKSDDALFAAFIGLQMRKYQPRRGRIFTQKPRGF